MGQDAFPWGSRDQREGRQGQAAKGSRADWYAQAAFPQGRFVSYAGMSSKGTPGCRGAPGMNCPPWELSREAGVCGSQPFPRGNSSFPLIFLTKKVLWDLPKTYTAWKKPGSNRGWHLGGAKSTVISHFAQDPAGIRC